ncbi:MAG: hypothetical protein N3D11_11505, partial [Candidatus Sumerlaeia bacterium]|nr:hypothetical protein [Candidatus Sumerlaeia bacterium]
REVVKKDTETCRPEHKHLAVFGVCGRNIECWICADPDWIAKQTGRSPSEFQVQDPKRVFESAMGISARDRKEEEIARLVNSAPLRNWLTANDSFEHFYGTIWHKSKELGCAIENLRERA